MNYMNAEARELWGHILRRHPQTLELAVDDLVTSLRGEKRTADRNAIVKNLRAYQGMGLGSFKAGRKGHQSRMKWRMTPNALNAQTGSNGVAGNTSPTRLLDFPVLLRPGLSITVTLPEDLSGDEADRVAEYIRSLPIRKPAP